MTADDFPAYSGPDKRCPKCHGEVSTNWTSGSGRQFLHRECRNCRYGWAEACVDGSSNPAPDGNGEQVEADPAQRRAES